MAAILKACWNSGLYNTANCRESGDRPSSARFTGNGHSSNIKLNLHYDENHGEPVLTGSLQNDTRMALSIPCKFEFTGIILLNRESAAMPQPVSLQPPPDTSRLFGLTFLHQSIDPLSHCACSRFYRQLLNAVFPPENSYVKYDASVEYSIESAKGWR